MKDEGGRRMDGGSSWHQHALLRAACWPLVSRTTGTADGERAFGLSSEGWPDGAVVGLSPLSYMCSLCSVMLWRGRGRLDAMIGRSKRVRTQRCVRLVVYGWECPTFFRREGESGVK